MKILFTYCKALSTIGFILGLAVLMSYKPAIAGHWAVSFEYQGSSSRGGDYFPDNGTFPWTDSKNVAVKIFNSSNTVNNIQAINVLIGGSGSPPVTLTSVGTLRAVLTWTADNPGDTSLPPQQLSIIERVSVLARTLGNYNDYPSTASASDSFGDPPVYIDAFPASLGRESAACYGNHVVTMPVAPGQTIVKFPPFRFSDSITISGQQNTCGGELEVLPTTASLQGYSTHCAPALGGSDPKWTPAAPRYFSGTGCQAQGTAVPASGYLSHVQLCVGDTVVKEYWDTSATGCPNPAPTDNSVVVGTNIIITTLNALFDSTHFISGAMVALKLKVWDSNGGYYDGGIQGPAKNRIYAIGNHTFSFNPMSAQILSNIQQDAQSVNYFVVTTQEDRKPNVISTIPAYTVMYVYSHGGVDTFGDCSATSPIFGLNTSGASPDYYLNLTDVQLAVMAKNPNQPPYNLEFLDCCNTAGDETISPSIYWASTFINANPYTEKDRAFLGWKNEVMGMESNAGWTNDVFDNLSIGLNLSDATLVATLNGPELGKFYFPVFPEIIGDTKMKLHGVYGASSNDLENILWYRPL